MLQINQRTMSSREIAKLCNSSHDNVLKTVRRLIELGIVLKTTPSKYTNEQNHQTYVEYLSDKRDSLIIVARLSPEFTAAIIDRWQELENQQQPKLPTTFAEALQLAADQAKLLELQAPKVQAFDALIGADTLFSMNQTAKLLNWGRNNLFKELRNRKILMENNLPYQQHIDNGRFVVKDTPVARTIGTMIVSQTYVTTKGQVWLNNLLGDKNA